MFLLAVLLCATLFTVKKTQSAADVIRYDLFLQESPRSHRLADLTFSHTIIITRTCDTGDVIRTYDSPVIVNKTSSKGKKHNCSKKTIRNFSFCDELPVSKFSHT